MADHLTEEEQIEAIKRWWSENWLSIVLPILVAILAYTGWNYWNDHKEAQAQSASNDYQTLTQLLAEADAELDEPTRNEALAIAQEIREGYAGGLYADMSAMIVAKLQLEAGNIEQAEQALRDVVESPSTDSIELIAQSRLAKVLLEQDKHQEAFALVAATDDPAVKALFAEIRGDIYLDQGERAAAHTAYQEAISSLSPQQFGHRGMLQFKLDGTRVATPAATPVEPEAAAEVETADADASTNETEAQE